MLGKTSDEAKPERVQFVAMEASVCILSTWLMHLNNTCGGAGKERRQGELAKSLALYLKFLNIPEQLKTRLSVRGKARRIKWKATRQVDTDSNAGQQGGKIGQDYHIS